LIASLRIWGSGVRISPGAPLRNAIAARSAAGAVAAGNLYNIAAKDGTVMEMFQRETLLALLLESRNIENRYDARQFSRLVVSWSSATGRG
jgi:hypothetical protein